jgi:hypothetical protein
MEDFTMYRVKRLKSSGPFPGLFIPMSILAVFILMILLFDVKVAYYVLATFFIFFGLTTYVAYFQLRNPNLLVVGTYQTVLGLLCAFAPRDFGSHGNPHPLTAILLVLMFFFGIWTVYLMINKKAKWRGREILELAAVPVEAGEDAFTDRPRPVGTVETSERELQKFAEFLKHNFIAMPLFEENRIVLLPMKEGWDSGIFIFRMPKTYVDRTWIAFDYEGNVTVSISQSDYLNYQEELSFDQLCTSLGNVFINFLDFYSNGKAVRIIDQLNAMPTNIFS